MEPAQYPLPDPLVTARKDRLDACVTHFLHGELGMFSITTASYAGYAELADRDLLQAIESEFDVPVTHDRHLAD
ncbi:MAG: hypothetical protein AAGJ70_06550 [Pseudomonadota bacterium]